MKKVNLYTDGACSGNPGPGGWAAILEYSGHEKELSGYCEQTTNNRMEISAVVKGLAALKEPCEVDVYSDSAYVINAFEKGWIEGWRRNGWKNSKKLPVENKDLWEMLINKTKEHNVRWNKVKGHSGHDYNERCDALARQQIVQNVI